MKRTIAAIVGLALLVTLSASAQDMKSNRIRVPFAFMAGDKTLPAGEYRVQINVETRVVLLFNRVGAVASMWSVSDGDGFGQDDAMQFQRFGDVWVLRQVKARGFVRNLIPTKLEQRQLAKLNPPGPQTLIASSVPSR